MDRINPNTANWPSLARLPKIGRVRALDIVEYRDQFINKSNQPDRPAFKTVDDLQNIKGIGPKTAEQLSEHLIFTEP
ncbi:MAG: helix-hairpin-helix domain-containing protein [Sedimentisphaerales bacterium]|nr:helix-hairpin-helix domain-containing protein [Sedimentisphaerales bacterium]